VNLRDIHTHGAACEPDWMCVVTDDELLAEMLLGASMFELTLHEAFRRIDAEEEPITGTLIEVRMKQARWLWSSG